jgi:hypothetical protein
LALLEIGSMKALNGRHLTMGALRRIAALAAPNPWLLHNFKEEAFIENMGVY